MARDVKVLSRATINSIRVIGVSLLWVAVLGIVARPTSTSAEQPAPITASRVIRIDVSGGQLVQLPADAGSEFVADPTIADIQAPKPSSVFVFGKKPGRTTLFVLTPAGKPLAAYIVEVRFRQAELDAQIVSGAGAAGVRLKYTANGALLEGTVADAQTAERLEQTAKITLGAGIPLSNQLRVAGSPQVNLRVRVAEVSRSVSRQLGFNWSTVLSAGNVALGMQTGRLAGAAAGANLVANGLNGVFGTVASKQFNGSVVLDAMANEGLATILAEPNLTAMSGNTATFLAGGEIPIPVPQALGTVSVEYKKYGISVSFSPTVLSSANISIKVSAEVSALDAANAVQLNNSQIPALTTRRAETTLELASGQSFAIAGLIQNDDSNNIQRLSGLGDIPVLGSLFRSSKFQRNESELIIVVSLYVVRPTQQLPHNPTANVRTPSDTEAVFGPATGTDQRFNGTALPPATVGKRMGYVFE